MRLRLFCSDLDGTLITPGSDSVSADALAFLASVRPRMSFAYVTGRHLELAQEGLARTDLPRPDHLACDVGTSLFHWERGRWKRDEDYRREMRRRLGATATTEILEQLAGLPGIRPQEDSKQAEFKASFYWPQAEGPVAVRKRVEGALKELGVTATLILSTDPDAGTGLLDILPDGASKASALEHLQRSLGLSAGEVLFAGDSGNDVEAILSGAWGVLVGNAPEDVRDRIRRAAASRGLEDRIVFASGHNADGVIEGWRRLGLG